MGKKPARIFMYSDEHPQGQIFSVDEVTELGDEWVDNPAKLQAGNEAPASNDMLQAYLSGRKIANKDGWIAVAEALGAKFDKTNMPVTKDIKAGIVATMKEVALMAEVRFEDVTLENVADYLAATDEPEGDDGDDS